MKKMFFSAVAFAVVAVSAVAVAPTTSEAVPAFARQTGAACLNCHFQAIPRLAAFGRNFRMNAYRDMGEQALIEDEHLSLPAVFNASFLMKARFSTGDAKLNGIVQSKGGLINTGTPTGATWQVQFPDETALLFGGRIGEHAGILNEMGFNGAAMDLLGAKVAYVFDLDAGIVALALGTSDALGAPSIFNDPSNAISRNLRGIQTRANALRSTVLHTGATGVGVYGHIADSLYFAVGGLLGKAGGALGALGLPAGGAATGNLGVDVTLSPYLRAAYTGEVAGFDIVAGGYYADVADAAYKTFADPALQAALVALGVVLPANTGLKNPRKEIGLDIQVQGDLGDASVGFYAPIVIKAETTNSLTNVKTKVTGYNPYVNVAFGPMGVRVGYDSSKTTVSNNPGVDVKYSNVFFGAWYDVAQNLTLDLEVDIMKTTNAAFVVNDTLKQTATTLQIEYVY